MQPSTSPAPNPATAAAPGSAPAPTAVLDTNVVLDAWVFRDASVASLVQALLEKRVRWLASPGMRQELVHTLALPLLQRWQPDAPRVLALFDAHAELVDTPTKTPLRALWCSDTDDQVFMDLALAHRTTWLLTKDRALLKLARQAGRCGVRVAKPAAWVASDLAPQ